MWNEVKNVVTVFAHCVIPQVVTHISVSNFYQLSERTDGQMDDKMDSIMDREMVGNISVATRGKAAAACLYSLGMGREIR